VTGKPAPGPSGIGPSSGERPRWPIFASGASADFPAWIVWAAVHISFLTGFSNRLFVILQWRIAFLTKRRQVRVFPGKRKSRTSALRSGRKGRAVSNGSQVKNLRMCRNCS
jgi:hypothetical protein